MLNHPHDRQVRVTYSALSEWGERGVLYLGTLGAVFMKPRSLFEVLAWWLLAALLLVLLCVMLRRFHKSNPQFSNFKKWNAIKLTVACLIVSLIAGKSIELTFGAHSSIDNIIPVASFFLAIFGLCISTLIFFTVSRDKTIKMLEYVRKTTEILRESGDDDVVYMIAPTFCPGLSSQDPKIMHAQEKLQKIIKKKFSSSHKKNKLAFLTTGIDNIEKFLKKIEEADSLPFALPDGDLHLLLHSIFGVCDYSTIDEAKEVANVKYKKMKALLGDISFVPLGKNFLTGIESFVVGKAGLLSAKANVVEQLRKGPICGFLATANVTKGRYYLGAFTINEDFVTYFEGTEFMNEGISLQMTKFLDSFIAENKAVAPK